MQFMYVDKKIYDKTSSQSWLTLYGALENSLITMFFFHLEAIPTPGVSELNMMTVDQIT